MGFFLDIPQFLEPGLMKRATGGSDSGPALAMSILYGLPFLAHWLASSRTFRSRLALSGVLAVNLLGMITTYSRGGALVTVALFGWMLMAYRHALRPRRVLILGFTGVAAVLLALVLVPASYWERQLSLTDQSDFSVGRRTTYLFVAREAFAARPLLGYGHDTFQYLYGQTDYARAYARQDQETLRRRAHNTYIEAAIGSGVLGLAAFLGMLAAAWHNYSVGRSRARARGDMDLASLIGAYRMAFGALLVYFLIYSNLDNKYLIFALALSFVARLAGEGRAAPKGGRRAVG
jgi:O-antigen ligase